MCYSRNSARPQGNQYNYKILTSQHESKRFLLQQGMLFSNALVTFKKDEFLKMLSNACHLGTIDVEKTQLTD